MARKPKRASAGPGAARQKSSAAAQSRSQRDFLSASLRGVLHSNGFTMKDEARNTGQHASLWGRDTNLRAKPISFVSAGLIEPLKEQPPDTHGSQPSEGEAEAASEPVGSLKEKPQESSVVPGVDESEDDATLDQTLLQPLASTEAVHPPESSGTGETTDLPAVQASHFDGLGFVVDVTGDKTLAENLSCAPPEIPDPESSAEKSDASSEVILFKGRANLSHGKDRVEQKAPGKTITLDTIRYGVRPGGAPMTLDLRTIGVDSKQQLARPNHRASHVKSTKSENEEDAIMADYIANTARDSDEGDEDVSGPPFTSQDLGAIDYESGDNSSQVGGSTGISGASDAEGGDVDDVEGDASAADHQDLGVCDAADTTIDDETLARLLAKQEELGMGSDELLLASAITGGHRSVHCAMGSPISERRGKRLNTRARGPFPSASAVADAFDELDLIDWERPSLQNQRNRGRRGQPPVFDVSDSELEHGLQAAWLKDRESRKSRRILREERRAQGLLGKHANPDDSRLKYPTGMTLGDLKTEMRNFLIGSQPRLELPPMDKSSRKILHELANKFKVKSQSTGSGDQRRPTLIRTKHTTSYVEEHFEIAISRVERKHFPRLDLRRNGKATPRKSRVGGGNAAVTYQEGEIVGASAPELGLENKGRAMLEKMGWSNGMALGSLDNKGILQPVAHVVKRSKAGLG